MHGVKGKLFSKLINHFFSLSLLFTSNVILAAEQRWQYLDPLQTTKIVDQNVCLNASPAAILEVSPYTQGDKRLYRVEQIFDTTVQKKLYKKSMDDQIKEKRFVAKRFCEGIAYLSDMDLPFYKR